MRADVGFSPGAIFVVDETLQRVELGLSLGCRRVASVIGVAEDAFCFGARLGRGNDLSAAEADSLPAGELDIECHGAARLHPKEEPFEAGVPDLIGFLGRFQALDTCFTQQTLHGFTPCQ